MQQSDEPGVEQEIVSAAEAAEQQLETSDPYERLAGRQRGPKASPNLAGIFGRSEMMDELREKIASRVRNFQWDSATDISDAEEIADQILAIPKIAEALKAKQREETIHRSGNLGPSISTNRRDPV